MKKKGAMLVAELFRPIVMILSKDGSASRTEPSSVTHTATDSSGLSILGQHFGSTANGVGKRVVTKRSLRRKTAQLHGYEL